MKRFFILAVCALFAGFSRAEAFDVSGFAKMLKMTVVSQALAPEVELPGFQALVRLSAAIDGFSYFDFQQEKGGDIAFVDADGNLLAHEVDTWNELGESLVWVKIPSLANGTQIRMYYSNPGFFHPIPAHETWSAFAGVWHMKEPSGVVSDSTGNGLDATPAGALAAKNIGIDDGVVGLARKNGGTGEYGVDVRAYLSIPNDEALRLGDTFTASGFFRVTATKGWYRLFSRCGSGITGGWGQEVHCDNAENVLVYGDAVEKPVLNIPGLVGDWVHLAFVYGGNTCKVYANGALAGTLGIVPASDNGAPLALGCTSDGGDWCLYGDYDEARLCKGALSPERIAADYAAATDSGFFEYEAVESLAVGGIDPSVFARSLRLTVPASSVPAGVTIGRFPALVRLSEKIDGFRYEDFMSNGADLVFADESGRVLPHEIDTWNTEGESLVWVRVPALRAGGVFYAYWGGGKSTAVPADVWSGFAGVWHMKEPSGVVSDSTGNGLDATPSGALAAKNIGIDDGVVGLARKNGGTGEDGDDVRAYLSIPNEDALQLGDTFTASGFFRVTATKGWYRLFSRCGFGITGGWGQEVHCDNAEKVFVYGDAVEKPALIIPGLVGGWVHLAFVYGGNTCKVYANGALAGTLGIVPASDNGAPLALGCTSDGGDWCLFGDYDEARLCKGALSPERIAADYATAVRSDFFDYGSVEVLAVNPPVVDKPVLSRNEAGEMAVSVSMISGTGRVHARFVSAGATVDVSLSDGAVTGPVAYSLAVPVDRLLPDRTYSVMAVGINASGGEIVAEGEETFYLGSLAVEKTADAAEDGPVPGVFTVSRADTHGDLTVNYSFGGSAAAGVDYAGAAHGTVTIPAGASSAVVTVTPKVNAAVNADTAVVFAFADGFYPASGATASMAIANLPPAARQDFEKCIRFSFPMAFLAADETLENFPVLIRLSESIPGFSYGAFRLPRGGDMMFTDSSGTPIPSEISTWDASGTSLVWVSVPKLAKGTVIKMYYGNGVNPAGVDVAKWPGYAGVWHLEEADGTAFDSAANSFDALAKRNASSLPKKDLVAVADGAAGRGRVNQTGTSYYTTKRSYLSVSEAIDDDIGAQFSFSGWFRTTEGTEWREPLACKLADGFDNGWVVSRLSSTTDPETQKESDRRLAVTVGDRQNVEFAIPDMRNNWVHVFVSFDSEAAGETRRSVARIYANGAFIDSLVAGREIGDSGYPLTFGNIDSVSSGDVFNGQYDELRLKRGASSPNWVKAEYLTIADPSFVKASDAKSAIGGFKIIVR